MTLIPATNMSKKPFFRRKNERITNVGGRIAGARSAEQSGYDYSVKKKGFFQTWRARSNQSKPLTRIVFGR